MSRRERDERGAVAIVVAVLLPLVFIGAAAFAIDVSWWELERQQAQIAADAAATAGVPYLPYDLDSATIRARAVAKRNGFDHADPDVDVLVERGEKPGQLHVDVVSDVDNSFGEMIGVRSATIRAHAVADYQAPAPMGSPCNTFGNEPKAGDGALSAKPSGSVHGTPPLPNCTEQPQLWATVEGPATGKIWGDRYQTRGCFQAGVAGCSGPSSNTVNDEYDGFGYVFVVKVEQAAVDSTIDLQIYDPLFVNTGQFCDNLPTSSQIQSANVSNDYVGNVDARVRYSSNGTDSGGGSFRDFCTGDFFLPESSSAPLVTSFVLRQQVDSQDPTEAPIQAGVDTNPCIKQYGGYTGSISTNLFKKGSGSYNADVAQTFHNWSTFCSFTPTRAGDYYLQVRSNVSLAGQGTALIKSGNPAAAAPLGNSTQGRGMNAFSLRAVTAGGLEKNVAVSGYEHMPIFANAPNASSTFNLLRVLPGAAGRRIEFEFFDAADIQGASGGTVKITMPGDATYTGLPFPSGGCTSKGGAAGAGATSSTCSFPVTSSANNGKVQQMTIPIPSDYSCDPTSLGNCWYRVTMSFPGASVNDITTWNARIVGDPIRLIE